MKRLQGLARRVSARRSVSSMAQEATQKSRIIVWFRDDLRLHDNPTVHAAATKVKSKQAAEVIKSCKALFSSLFSRLDGLTICIC